MPRPSSLAALSLNDDEDDATNLAATLRTSSLGREASYDVSLNDTFKVGSTPLSATIQLQGAKGMVVPGSSTERFSDVELPDLERGKMVGRGATGRVYLVTHKSSKQRYALKELTAIADDSARQQAMNELRIATSHCHQTDHLVKLINGYFDDGKICMLMEYCDGGSLADQLRMARELNAPTVPLGQLAFQILHGLRYMHEQMKQVHRDLKPANILLTSDGVAKLSDFGVSKHLGMTNAVAVTQVGSTAYMSPERLKGEEYSYVSDVWSLGVIVLEALRGSYPFDDKSYISIFKAICETPAPPPPEGTPAEQVDFVCECLHIEAAGRASVGKMLDTTWMRKVGAKDVRQPVFRWLMMAAAAAATSTQATARDMAMRAIATSAR